MEDAPEPRSDHEGSPPEPSIPPEDAVGPAAPFGPSVSHQPGPPAASPAYGGPPGYGGPYDPTPAPVPPVPPGDSYPQDPPAAPAAYGGPGDPATPWTPSPSAPQGPVGGANWPPPPANYPQWGSQNWPTPPPPNPYGGPPVGPGTWSGSWSGGWPPDAGGPPTSIGPGGWETPWSPGGDPARPRRTLPSAITVLLLAVAVLVGLGLGHSVWRSGSVQAIGGGASNGGTSGSGFGLNPFGNNNSGSGSSGSGAPSDTGGIAAKASPALVDINTDLSYEGGEAAGTGIVLTPTGLVLTNNHVISGATRIQATDVGNGHSYTGQVLGYDRSHDVALVQLEGATGLPTATLGNSSQVAVGDQIVGLGNAGGLGGKPSSAGGTVTALDQSITASDEGDGTSEQLTGLIQVNANIQPGDSGGALVDTNGHVIGIDTAASAGFNIQATGGQGYAIPINEAIGIARQIQAGQHTASIHIGPTAFLGVLVASSGSSGPGATLANAVPGGPAAQAGLTSGDTITSVAGHSVDKPSTLTNLILLYHPGDKVEVGWSDSSGQMHQATVTLASGPAQ